MLTLTKAEEWPHHTHAILTAIQFVFQGSIFLITLKVQHQNKCNYYIYYDSLSVEPNFSQIEDWLNGDHS